MQYTRNVKLITFVPMVVILWSIIFSLVMNDIREMEENNKLISDTQMIINNVDHDKFCEIAISRNASNDYLEFENCIKITKTKNEK